MNLSTKPNYLKFASALLIIVCNMVFYAEAQNSTTGILTGTVKTSDGIAISNATLELAGTGKSTVSAKDGTFSIQKLKPGTYQLKVSHIAMVAAEKSVEILAGTTATVEFILAISSARLADISVTASANQKPVEIGKGGLAVRDMLQSVTVINSQVIEDQQAQRLSDVIKNVSGVSMGSTRGATSETFFARGYNLGSNNIMKNGSRSNSAAIPEASTLEKVEVLKGSAALLYGNVSSGALINMVTKQPKFEYGGEISLRSGSYGLLKPIGDLYGPISKNLAFRIVGTYEDAASYRNSVQSNRTYINPSLLYKVGLKTDLLLQADYLKNDFTPDFGIGSIDNKIPTSISRSSFFNTPWAYNKVRQATATANLDHRFNNMWKLNFIGSYQQFTRNYFSTERIAADAAGDWSRTLTRSKTAEDYYTGQLNLTGSFATGKIAHAVLVGTDAEQYLNESNAFTLPSAYDKINLFNPSKYAARTDEPVAVLLSRTETPTYRLGYYAQDLISLTDKFKILAGIRWSYQKAAIAKTFDANTGQQLPVTTKGKIDKAFSPRAGIVYQPTTNTSFFASYSNNFTPNTGNDIYGANLKPSIINQYEAGIKQDFLNGKLSANFTVYKIINSDLAIQAQFDKNGNVNTVSTIKEFSGQTTSDGLELDLNGNINAGLNFLAGYSYNFMRYTETVGGTGSYIVGERLVSNPAHTANATVFYTFNHTKLKGLKLGASGFYTGERNAGWNNTVGQSQKYNRLIPVSAFTTFDVSAGYSFRKLSLLGKLSNIGNALNYYVHENYSVNPIPPRQFIATMSYKF